MANRASAEKIRQRRQRVIALRSGGATWQQIGNLTGQSAGAAAVDYARGMDEEAKLLDVESPAQLALDLRRVDEMERAVRQVLAQARGIEDPDHPGRMMGTNPGMVLACVDRLLKIGETRTTLAARRPQPKTARDKVDELQSKRADKKRGRTA